MPYGAPAVDNISIQLANGKLQVKDQGLDAGKFVPYKLYTDPADGLRINHENKAVVRIHFTSGFQMAATDPVKAIEDGSVLGQKLRIILTSTATSITFTVKNNANTKLLGDWVRSYLTPGSVIPSWLDLVWDGADWLQTDTNDGLPTSLSGENAHAEGSKTTSSGYASHAEGDGSTASQGAAHAEGRNSTASAACSYAAGEQSQATDNHSRASGYYAKSYLQGQRAHAGSLGLHNEAGANQWTDFLLSGFTVTASPTELTGPERFVLQDGHSYACSVTVHGRRQGGADHAMFKRMVLIHRTSGTVALAGTVQNIAGIDTSGSWAVALTADDVNKSLKVAVTGGAYAVLWLARIEALDIKLAI